MDSTGPPRKNMPPDVASSQSHLDEKLSFYQKLDCLAQDDDLSARETSYRKRCRDFFHSPPAAKAATTIIDNSEARDSSPGNNDKAALQSRRISSAPTPAPAAKIIKGTPVGAAPPKGRLCGLLDEEDSTVIKETPPTQSMRSRGGPTRHGDTTPLNPATRRLLRTQSDQSPSVASGMRKRKRESDLKMRPQQEQIFRGLSFFYIPNDDIAPARRLRITKAREYGATWTTIASTATHVIVEKSINYREVEAVLSKGMAWPTPSIVVGEDYPLDCIQFRAILDHRQKKYLLSGQPSSEQEDTGLVPASSSEQSAQPLEVKSPPRNRSRRNGAAARSNESTPHGSEPQAEVDSQPIVLELEPDLSADGGINDKQPEPKLHMDGGRLQAPGRKETGTGTGTHTHGRMSGLCAPDELSECITTMQEFKDLPLDVDDEEENQPAAIIVVSDSEDELHPPEASRRKPKRKSSRLGRKAMAFEDHFACNQAGERETGAANPNARTIEVLQAMAKYYERINDQWRTTAYRKAISTLKRQDSRINTEEEAIQLPNIGQRLAQKIEEIVTTDKLTRLEYAKAETMDGPLQLFLGVYGVGVRQAQQWIAQGFRTLEDLRDKAKLTANQRIGVEHFEDLNTRIPRCEVEALGEVVKTAANRIDPLVEVIIGGSYRRGAESSHDIDLLVTKPGTESAAELRGFLDQLIERLEADEFLVARLASSRTSGDGSKWHGCCVLPGGPREQGDGESANRGQGIWRRIDFLLVPESERGAALIYFTGNDIFNRSMRLLASKKKMRLNQRGLYKDVLRRPDRSKVTEGELVEGRDERRIFEILGVKWREPHERWC
ncbi:hypothetical protein B0I35DRAFT_419275 [Stachybotrys elegans]|uniref:DNA polymerase lambda n=1 Tax=Stachybotrys elegans TaxID=80388 RepID=A0A8K0WYN2_9HYPO|nr:hypothetical protein B0I35DRAFT_419275 [Stachybotrys elegans]